MNTIENGFTKIEGTFDVLSCTVLEMKQQQASGSEYAKLEEHQIGHMTKKLQGAIYKNIM